MPDLNFILEAGHLSPPAEKKKKLEMSSVLADHECILVARHNFKEKEEASVRLVLKMVSYSGRLSSTVTFSAPSYDEWM